MTNKDYCDYETALKLCALGYPGTAWILLYSAQKWLREEKKVIIVIVPYTYNIITETSTWTYEIWLEDNLEREVHDFNTYEEALSVGIKEAVRILKEEDND